MRGDGERTDVIELLSSEDEAPEAAKSRHKATRETKKRRAEGGGGETTRKKRKKRKKKKTKRRETAREIEIIEISSDEEDSIDEGDQEACVVVVQEKIQDDQDDGQVKSAQISIATPCSPFQHVVATELETHECQEELEERQKDPGVDGVVIQEESPMIRIDILFPELTSGLLPENAAPIQDDMSENNVLQTTEPLKSPLDTATLSTTPLTSLESPAISSGSLESSTGTRGAMEATALNSFEAPVEEPQSTLQAMRNAFEMANSVQVARDVSPEAENEASPCSSDPIQESNKKDKEDDPMLDVAPTLTFEDENELLPEDYIQNHPQPLVDDIELEHAASEESTPESTEPSEALMRLPDLGEDIASVISMIEHREELEKTIGHVEIEAAVGINPRHIEDINFDVRDLVLPKPVIPKPPKPLPPRTPKSFTRVFNRSENNEPIPSRRARYDLHMTNGRPLPPNLQEYDLTERRRKSSRSERRKRRNSPEVIELVSSSEEEFEAQLTYKSSDSRPEPQVRSKPQEKSLRRQNIIIMDDSDSESSSKPVKTFKRIKIKLPADVLPREKHKSSITKPTSNKQACTKPSITKSASTKPSITKSASTKPSIAKSASTKPAITKSATAKRSFDDSAIRANRFNISRPTQCHPEEDELEILRHPTAAERHQIFINVVKVTYQQQRHKSDYTNLPQEFVVPSEAPWPEMLWGTFVDVKAFREAHTSGLLSNETVAELDKLRFVWDPSVHQWHVQITAFQRYKELYGDLCIPHNFEIPDKDKRWPKDVWKVALGIVAHNLRHKSSALTPVRKQQLSALGFIWEMEELQWRIWYKALLTYYNLNGHVDVPIDYVVPENDATWTPDSWNEKLGQIVVGLRSEAKSLSAARKWQLDELGFVWGPGMKKKKRKRHPVPQRLPRQTSSDATVDKACLGAYSAPHFPMFGEKAESTARWDEYGEKFDIKDTIKWPRCARLVVLEPHEVDASAIMSQVL